MPAPCAAHVVFWQPHWLGVPPPPHVLGCRHTPQLSKLLQLSESMPHVAPAAAHVLGLAHGPVPHLLGPPPPHVWEEGHEPQPTVPPHPSAIVPQLAPVAAHVFGAHGPPSGLLRPPSGPTENPASPPVLFRPKSRSARPPQLATMSTATRTRSAARTRRISALAFLLLVDAGRACSHDDGLRGRVPLHPVFAASPGELHFEVPR
jgi:hypothetical protein